MRASVTGGARYIGSNFSESSAPRSIDRLEAFMDRSLELDHRGFTLGVAKPLVEGLVNSSLDPREVSTTLAKALSEHRSLESVV